VRELEKAATCLSESGKKANQPQVLVGVVFWEKCKQLPRGSFPFIVRLGTDPWAA
jgi:hypothetical protein